MAFKVEYKHNSRHSRSKMRLRNFRLFDTRKLIASMFSLENFKRLNFPAGFELPP